MKKKIGFALVAVMLATGTTVFASGTVKHNVKAVKSTCTCSKDAGCANACKGHCACSK